MNDADLIAGAVGAAVAISAAAIRLFKVKDKYHCRLIVLGVSAGICLGAKLTGAGFDELSISALVFKTVIVAGASNLGYQAVVHPISNAVKKSAKNLVTKLKSKSMLEKKL